jgi:hypothetical protein
MPLKNFYYIVDFDQCQTPGYLGKRYVVWTKKYGFGIWRGLTETKMSNFCLFPTFKQEDLDLVIKYTANSYVKFINPITKKDLELLQIEEKLRIL